MANQKSLDAPQVRLPQLGAANAADLLRSVNLFRGEVGYTLSLLALDGRNGLDLSLAATYGSNVGHEIATWNREAPTSALGVGWSLPSDRIVVADRTVAESYNAAFYLISGGGSARLYRIGEEGGAILFQAREHQFWQIRYFPDPLRPDDSRWEITRDDGSVWTYGGQGAVEGGVAWSNWVGPTTANGGKRFPVAWNVRTIRSLQADVLSFDYEMDEVMVGNCSYTRFARLRQITDVFGQTATLSYAAKEPFEIELPWTAPAPASGEAFQFTYETRFLATIDVRGAAGDLLFQQQFGYTFLDLGGSAAAPGQFRKRYLQSVRQQTAAGELLAGLEFEYEIDTAAANPGAVRDIVYPLGAKAGYQYERIAATKSASSIQIDTPGADFVPGVWHGAGFSVITFYNAALKRLQVRVYSWSGKWRQCDLGTMPANVDEPVIHVGNGYFALEYRDAGAGRRNLYLFKQNEARPDEWDRTDLQLGGSANLAVAAGSDFIAFQGNEVNGLTIYQWNQLGQAWQRQTVPTVAATNVAIAAGQGYVLGAYYTAETRQVRFQTFYADAARTWRLGSHYDVQQPVDWTLTQPSSVWALGSSIAAATFITSKTSDTVTAAVALLQWRDGFVIVSAEVRQVSQAWSVENPILYSVLNDSLVGQAQNVFRYIPSSWPQATLVHPAASSAYRYAYGSDLALAVSRSPENLQEFSAQRFDPYLGRWVVSGAPAAAPLQGEDELRVPAVVGDYALLGRGIFGRQADSTWARIGSVGAEVLGQSLQLRPGGYAVYQTVGSPDTFVLFFRNGTVSASPQRLTGQSCYVPQVRAGAVLAGADTFVTFKGATFDLARTLWLYRVTDAALPEKLAAPALTRISLDDGYTTAARALHYDPATASFDPSGRVACHQTVRVSSGPDVHSAGETVHTFYNGLSPDDPDAIYPPNSAFCNVRDAYGFMNGHIYRSDTYTGQGRRESSIVNQDWVFSGVAAMAGFYSRTLRTDQFDYVETFTLPETDAQLLDGRLFTAQMRAAFEAAGVVLAGEPTVVVLAGGSLWRLDQDKDAPWYVEKTDDGLMVFGAVGRATEHSYNDRGQQRSTTRINLNSSGEQELLTQETAYAWESYPELAAANALMQVARVTHRNDTANLTTGIEVTTWSNRWPSAGASRVWGERNRLRWTGMPGTQQFDMNTWSAADQAPPGWILDGATTDRNARGAVLETRNVDRQLGGFLYDRSGVIPVASFVNASAVSRTASYYGFEPYEDSGPWQWSAGGADAVMPIRDGEAFAGSRCLALTGGSESGGLSATFEPAVATRRFLVSCRVRAFVPAAGGPGGNESGMALPRSAGWLVQVSGGARAPQTKVVPFPSGEQGWAHSWFVVDADQFGIDDIAQLRLTLFNGDPYLHVLVDAIFVTPFAGAGRADVYAGAFRLTCASVSSNGQAKWIAYDRLQRPVSEIGTDGTPRVLTAAGNWRLGGAGFDPARPNATFQATVREGGLYADFRQGDAFRAGWDATPDWQLQHEPGRLVHQGAGIGRVSQRDAPLAPSVAIRCTFEPLGALVGPIGLGVVGKFDVRWLDGAWELRDADSALACRVSAAAPGASADCLVTVSGPAVYLIVDGELVLAHRFETPVAGAGCAFAAGAVAIRDLLVAVAPVVTCTYADNAGRPLQSQSLDGADIVVSQPCRDELVRPALQTKGVRFAATSLGYRPAFVQSVDWSTGVMTGEVADAFPADAGYPYGRSRFSRSPASRVIESGLPGQALAIDERVAPAERRTARHRVGANVRGELGGMLPACHYLVNTAIDQDRRFNAQVLDALGRIVIVAEGQLGNETRMTRHLYDAAGRLCRVEQPNYFDHAVAAPELYVVEQRHDFLGRVVALNAPDASQSTLSVYDDAGRLRFQRDARGALEGFLVYHCYDERGRPAETGVCQVAWDRDALQAHANDRTWLPSAGNWSRRFAYDGDGADLSLIGRLAKTSTRNGADDTLVEEVFAYDAEGRITSRQQIVAGLDEAADQTVAFEYDQLGNLTAMRDASGDGRFGVSYGFDLLGRPERVALALDDGAGQAVARYDYGPDGALLAETLAPATPSQLVRSYEYSAAGWLESISDRFFSHKQAYFEGGYAGATSYGGRVVRVEDQFASLDGPAGFLARPAVALAYDGFGQMRVAQIDANPQWTLGVPEPLTYDHNGNLLALSRDAQPQALVYGDGSNRLERVEGGDQGAFRYDPDGQLAMASTRGISAIDYEPALGLSLAVTNGAGRVGFRYGGAGVRVSRSGADGSLTVYMLDPSHRVLWQTVRDRKGTLTRTYFVHGPNGVVAMHGDGQTHYLLRDARHSVRAIYDGSALCAAYNYAPWGAFLGAVFERGDAARRCPFRFSGQEFDAELGLYIFPARLYDADLGRFYGIDPAAQYPSPYLYAGNDPYNFIDPTGAWSWAAFGAILGGLAAAIGGVVLIVASGGAATPALAALYGVGGSALLGAGIGSAAYGATHMSGNFKGGEWAAMTGLGGLFGAISGGIGLATSAITSPAWAVVAEVASGIAVGGTDGVVTNGVINVVNARDFGEQAGAAFGMGALAGGLSGALGGLLGRGVAFRNARTLSAMGPRNDEVVAGWTDGQYFFGHSIAGRSALTANRANQYFEQALLPGGGRGFRAWATGGMNGVLRRADAQPGDMLLSLHVDNAALRGFRRAELALSNAGPQPTGMFVNDCTSNAIRMLEGTGLTAPLWARTPPTLALWFRSLGAA